MLSITFFDATLLTAFFIPVCLEPFLFSEIDIVDSRKNMNNTFFTIGSYYG